MSKPRKVVWTKGMFLMPQHFQAQDEYVEHALHFRSHVSSFANWGLSRLAVDEASLVNGLFTLRHCEGILPDGLAFQAPLNDDLPAGRQVEEFFSPTAQSLDVFLAIPQLRQSAKNFNLSPSDDGHQGLRYSAETRTAIDLTLGSDEKTIQVASKSLRLVFAGENLDGSTSLRIARIVRSSSSTYLLSPDFIPPLLDILASELLMTLARRQVEAMTAKSTALALPRRQRGRDLADFSTGEAANFWLLHTVNSYLPEIKHIWKVRRGHPDVLYCAMLRLAGALTTFALNEGVHDLPDYDHNNLGQSFAGLDARIRGLLETVLPSKCIAVPLRLADRLVWTGSIADERHLEGAQFLLAVSTPIAVDELIAKFPRLAKISASDEINRLVRNSLPGLVVRHLPSPPASVPLNLGCQYFGLVQSGPLWERIVQSRALSVFVPAEIAEPKMELVTILN